MYITRCNIVNNIFFKGRIIELNDAHGHTGNWSSDNANFPAKMVNGLVKDTFETTINGHQESVKVRNVFVSNLSCLDKKPNGTPLLREIEGNQSLIDECVNLEVLRPLLVCQPTNGGSAQNIRQLLEANKGKVFGFKFHPELGIGLDETYTPYMKLAEEYAVPCVFHSGVVGSVSDPWKIYELAKQSPKVPVVLYHMSLAPFGKVGDLPVAERLKRGLIGQENKFIWEVRDNWNNEGIEVAKTALKRGDANLYVETSWTKPETVVQAIRELGVDRVLFGTDTPLGDFKDRGFYIQNLTKTIQAVKDAFGENSEEVIRKVFYENAKELFIDRTARKLLR